MSTTQTPLLLRAPLSGKDRLFADRFSYGYDKTLAKDVAKAGGGRAWFEQQLAPSAIKDTAANETKAWYPNLWHSPARLFYRNYHDIYPSWELMNDLGRWTMMRRIMSRRQLHEMMVEFWSNLLHIAAGDDLAWPYRISYDALIRKHALGRFDEMLAKATIHPAMGLWLDNATSTKYQPNENLGRELLELHSVGVDAGYTQRDVEMAAKMLTGYRVDIWVERVEGSGEYDGVYARYEKDDHYVGKIRVFGFTNPNGKKDGRVPTDKMIRYLAHHPATAKRIARRLAVRFVNDEPSNDLVRTIERAWTRSGTDIKATLRAMVTHPDFAKSGGDKVRTPLEDLIATVRALGIQPLKPRPDSSDFANAIFWTANGLGQTPYYWPAPNGHPEDNLPWSSAGRVLNSFDMHRGLANEWWPRDRARFRDYAYWLPPKTTTFGGVVNHISGKLLGVPASAKAKRAIATRVGIPLSRTIRKDDLQEYVVRQVLTALLGSPAHMTR